MRSFVDSGTEIASMDAGNMLKNSKFYLRFSSYFLNRVEKLKELVMECFDKLYDAVEKAQQEKRMLAGKN